MMILKNIFFFMDEENLIWTPPIIELLVTGYLEAKRFASLEQTLYEVNREKLVMDESTYGILVDYFTTYKIIDQALKWLKKRCRDFNYTPSMETVVAIVDAAATVDFNISREQIMEYIGVTETPYQQDIEEAELSLLDSVKKEFLEHYNDLYYGPKDVVAQMDKE